MKKIALFIALICAGSQLYSMENNNNNSSSKQLIDLRSRQSLSPHQASLISGIESLRPNRVTESLSYLLIGLPEKPICPSKSDFQQVKETTKTTGDSWRIMLFKKRENIKLKETTKRTQVIDNATYKKACDDYSVMLTSFDYELKIAKDFQNSLNPFDEANFRSLCKQYNNEEKIIGQLDQPKRPIYQNRKKNKQFFKEAQQTAQIVQEEQEAKFQKNAQGKGLKNWMRWYKAGMGLSAALGVASLGIWNSRSTPAEHKFASLFGMAAAVWGGITSFVNLHTHVRYYQNRVNLAKENVDLLENFNKFEFKSNDNNSHSGAGNQPEYEIYSLEKKKGGSSSDSDSSEGESSKSSTSSESSSSETDSDSDDE